MSSASQMQLDRVEITWLTKSEYFTSSPSKTQMHNIFGHCIWLSLSRTYILVFIQLLVFAIVYHQAKLTQCHSYHPSHCFHMFWRLCCTAHIES